MALTKVIEVTHNVTGKTRKIWTDDQGYVPKNYTAAGAQKKTRAKKGAMTTKDVAGE